MTEFKIIEYWLRNRNNTYTEIADYFKTTAYFVSLAIDNYLKNPYIVRESKLNTMEL